MAAFIPTHPFSNAKFKPNVSEPNKSVIKVTFADGSSITCRGAFNINICGTEHTVTGIDGNFLVANGIKIPLEYLISPVELLITQYNREGNYLIGKKTCGNLEITHKVFAPIMPRIKKPTMQVIHEAPATTIPLAKAPNTIAKAPVLSSTTTKEVEQWVLPKDKKPQAVQPIVSDVIREFSDEHAYTKRVVNGKLPCCAICSKTFNTIYLGICGYCLDQLVLKQDDTRVSAMLKEAYCTTIDNQKNKEQGSAFNFSLYPHILKTLGGGVTPKEVRNFILSAF